VNVPWPADGLGDSDYALAFAHVVCPITAAFAPDVVLISAGFDAAEGDAQVWGPYVTYILYIGLTRIPHVGWPTCVNRYSGLILYLTRGDCIRGAAGRK